jgi:glycosyltransferase involved in cell wall biosynthesis
MKRIAIIHYTYPPVVGGVEFIIESHARLLAKAGHNVKIISGRGKADNRNIEVHLVRNFTAQDKKVKLVQKELFEGKITRNFENLKKELKANIKKVIKDIDICFIHNIFTMHFNMALTAALSEIISESKKKKIFYAWCHDASLNNKDYIIPYAKFYPWTLLGQYQKKVE